MRNAPPIFKDPSLQERFVTDGFVKIELLTVEDIVTLKKLFYEQMKEAPDVFFSSSYLDDYQKKKAVSEMIGKIVLPRLEQHFTEYSWFGSAFLSKGSGASTEMPMHQDWTIVDEQQFVALNIWTPLQDTNEQNGTLEVIPGSHAFHEALRAPTLPFYYKGFENKMKQLLVPVHTKATEAVVLNQAVIHYSKPNMTPDDRLAITTGIKSKGAPMTFHYWNKEEPGQVEVFRQEDDFLLRWANFHEAIFKRPEFGTPIGKTDFQFPAASDEEVNALVPETHEEPAGKVPFWKRIFG